MRNVAMAKIVVLLLTLCLSRFLFASPASPATLDSQGCHVCKKVCEKFGLQINQVHCHIFSPESGEIYTKAAAGSAANSETMFAQNVLGALDYISLSDNRTQLFIGSMKKEIASVYKVIAQSCGLGGEDAQIYKGPPAKTRKVFGVPVPSDMDGLYTVALNKSEYLGIGTADNRILIIGDDDEIKCGGQFIKNNFYLYCKASISDRKNVGASGYCRTSLAKR